jgi:hypothetical protein
MRMLKIFSQCLTLLGLQRKHNLVSRRLPTGSDAGFVLKNNGSKARMRRPR